MHFKQRGFIWIEQLFQDIRFSLRMLRKKPGFAAIAVISLALAIGVNCGVFWFINEMLFRPLIHLRPDEVVGVYTGRPLTDTTRGGMNGYQTRFFSFPEFSLLRESDKVFADVSAIQSATVGVGAKNNGDMRWKSAYVVSDNYFSMLGVTPAMGRFFLPEESRLNANIPVVVVSRSLWESLGGGNDFSERTMAINGKIHTIVGVIPKGFSGTTAVAPDIWLPMGMASGGSESMRMAIGVSGQDLADPTTYALAIIARLQPGLTLEAAKARLPVLAERLTTIAADADEGGWILEIEPPSRLGFSTGPTQDTQRVFLFFAALLMAIPAVVLLVACLNLANMFLARNITRSDELAVRLALGASRRRVVRILSIEGLIIALLGGAAGLLISRLGIVLMLNSLMSSAVGSSSGISLTLDTAPDIRVLLATLLFCVIATLVFAVAPARHAIREIVKGNLSLQHSTRTTTDRWGRLFSAPNCLLMAQLAFSLALLFSAGLFFRAAHTAARLEPGFETDGDLVAQINYSLVHRDEASVRISIAALEEELRALPDVRKVAVASFLPFGSGEGRDLVTTAGAAGKQVDPAWGDQTAVSSGYFDTLGIKLLHGRDFTDLECRQAEGPHVVIIDQGMADRLFPGENPLGKYIQRPQMPGLDKLGETASEPMEIIGVVSTYWSSVLEESPPLRLFYPLASQSPQQVFVHVRGQTADAATSGSFRELVRNRLRSLDPDIPLVSLKPYPTILKEDTSLWLLRFVAVLIGIFGAFALLLAVIGVYGVRAFFVARRTREIGIRMALGASSRRIYALLMKQGAVLIAIGLCAGLMLSLAIGRILTHMHLYLRVSLGDPVALGMAVLILAFAALLATWIPARRAAKVDPMEVLRWE